MIYQIIDLQCETFCCCFIIIFSYSRCKSSIQEFNDDLKEVNDRAFQWEMSFNADPSKQAQEVIFRIGCNIRFQLWTLEDHLNNVLVKANKTVGLLRKLRNLLPTIRSFTIYKAFIRLHLDRGNVLYDQAFNKSKNWNRFNTTHA